MLPTRLKQSLAPAAVALLLGLIIALQVKTQVKVQQTIREARVSEERIAQLLAVNSERNQLLTELRRIKEDMAQARLHDELILELTSAGLLPVEGPGVTVTLADLSGAPASARQVAAKDILLVVNELRASGAEAIAVNGVRVTTWLRIQRAPRSGSLVIGDTTVEGPVVIHAVGDTALMTASLNMRGGIVQQLVPWIYVSVGKSDKLAIPALGARPDLLYARPLS